jgi:hypothetical protein
MEIGKLIDRLKEETELMADHAFISVQCSDLQALLQYIDRLEQYIEKREDAK